MEDKKAFLIRVGMDSTYGGFVSPIFPSSDYVFIPIPNVRKGEYQIDSSPLELPSYSDVKTNSQIPLTRYLPKDAIEIEGELISNPSDLEVHNDPEFKGRTYGEKKSKSVIYSHVKNFEEGDFIVFYGTFFPCNKDFKYRDYTLNEIKREQRGNKQYYIFAYLELKYPPIDASNYKEYEEEIQNNAHYKRGDFDRHDESFILKGAQNCGWLKDPIRIDKGREGSVYMMKDEIADYKLKNKDKKGLNRCYCRLEDSIIPFLQNS